MARKLKRFVLEGRERCKCADEADRDQKSPGVAPGKAICQRTEEAQYKTARDVDDESTVRKVAAPPLQSQSPKDVSGICSNEAPDPNNEIGRQIRHWPFASTIAVWRLLFEQHLALIRHPLYPLSCVALPAA